MQKPGHVCEPSSYVNIKVKMLNEEKYNVLKEMYDKPKV